MATERRAGIRAHFDASVGAWTRAYHDDTILGHVVAARIRGCLALAGNLRGLKVLDVGCGTGALLAEVGPEVARYVGIDFAPNMVAATRARATSLGLASRTTVLAADAAALPCPPDSFDVVVALGLMGFVADPGPVVRECLRVLSPDGRFIVSVPRRDSVEAVALAVTAPARAIGRALRSARRPPRLTTFGDRAFERVIVDAGGRIEQYRYYGMQPVPYPLSQLWPRLAHRWATLIEGRPAFKACATGLLASCRK